tara:strand:+ start:4022 stop:5050 length:1029 start_codon:yes stop_codon:yes gene_type:complete
MGLSKKEREALDLGEPGKGREWIIDEDRSEAILFDNNKMSVVSRHDLPNNEVRGNEAVQRKRSVDVRNAPRNEGSSAASLAIRGEHRTDANVQMDPSVVPRTPRGSEVSQRPLSVDPRAGGNPIAAPVSAPSAPASFSPAGPVSPPTTDVKPRGVVANPATSQALDLAGLAPPLSSIPSPPSLQTGPGGAIAAPRAENALAESAANFGGGAPPSLRAPGAPVMHRGAQEEFDVSQLLNKIKTLLRLGGTQSSEEIVQLYEELQAAQSQGPVGGPNANPAGTTDGKPDSRTLLTTVGKVGGLRIPQKYIEAILKEFGADFRRIQTERTIGAQRGGSRGKGVRK